MTLFGSIDMVFVISDCSLAALSESNGSEDQSVSGNFLARHLKLRGFCCRNQQKRTILYFYCVLTKL